MQLPEGIRELKELAYITSRKLADERGEKTGSVLLWRKKSDEVFQYTLKCRTAARSRHHAHSSNGGRTG